MPLPPRLPSRTVPITKPEKNAEVLANRYYVQKTLGSGNCGTALLVLDRRDKDGKEKLKVAKKIFIGNLQPDETVDANQEASLLRNLDHPNIVRFFDSFLEGEFFCIVTEYCEGGDLETKIAERKKIGESFPESQIIEWIVEILLALQYMHSRRILHRDLKTRNIFLRHNHIKIGDFGISRILIGTLDMASTFAGTPFYMSPEVLKHEGYNSKSDIWSVGCILYELVTLKRAFDGKTLMGVLYQITEVSAPSWPSDYSDDLAELFYRMLNKNPADRPSAHEALCSPLIRRHFEMLRATIIENHQSRDHRDAVKKDVVKIASAVNKSFKMDELQKESELKRFRYLPPRDRIRIEKQKKADEEGERIKGANLLLQKMETKQMSDRARQKNDPYRSKLPFGAGALTERESELARGKSPSFAAYTAPAGGRESIDEDSDDDTVIVGKSGRQSASGAVTTDLSRRYSADADDWKTVRSSSDLTRRARHSSLDLPEGIPEVADGRHHDDDDELEEMVANLEHYLLQDATLTDHTLVADDEEAGAFGPGARAVKINNLRIEAIAKLGQEKFDAIYNYLKKTRFDDRSASKDEVVDEKQVMHDLRRICSNSDLCAIVEQLLFLEVAGHS